MRKYIFTLICILGICTFYSCEDLNPSIYDKIGEGDFPKTPDDIEAYMTGIYGYINNGPYGGGFAGIATQSQWCLGTATTDEFDCGWGSTEWTTYRNFSWNSGDIIVYNRTYLEDIEVIARANIGLYYVENANISDELKSRYKAELKGIIAMYALSIYKNHGTFPVVEDPEILLNANSAFVPERPTREWMIDYIKTTARAAADTKELPAKYNEKDYGRITKGTALMVLLKLAMHEKNWAEAEAVSKEIIELGIYHLQDSYISVFSVENEMNDEIILASPMVMGGGNRTNVWLAHVLPDPYVDPNGYSIAKWGGYKVPWAMYEKYWDKTGLAPYDDANKDQRLEAIWHKINTEDGIVNLRDYLNVKGWEWTQKGAIPYKYPADPKGQGSDQGNDWVIYRYADVLLLRAEAINNQRPLDQEAVNLINQVRGRAKTTTVSKADFANGAALNDFILDERFRELFMEGFRREDLIRHGKYLEKAKERGATFTDENRLLFPIPPLVVNQSGGKGQNPGY